MLNIVNPYFTIPVPVKLKSARYLVAGRDHAMELADLTMRYLSLKGYSINQVATFDHEKSVTLNEIGVQSKSAISKIKFGLDLIVPLDNDSLYYTSLVSSGGKMIVDRSLTGAQLNRSDLIQVSLPISKITSGVKLHWGNEIEDWRLVSSCLFGALMAVENEYLDSTALAESLSGSQFVPSPPYTLATYLSYDWVKEQELTGKSEDNPLLWQISKTL